MPAPNNSNESYCTFTLASDVTAGGLPSEDDIANDLEDNDPEVSAVVRDTVSRRDLRRQMTMGLA